MGGTDGPTPWSRGRRAAIALGAFALAGLAFLAGTGWDVGVVTDWFGDDEPVVRGDWAIGDAVAADTDDAAGVVASVEVAPALGEDGRCVRIRLADEVVEERCSEGPLNPWDDPDFDIVRLGDHFGSFHEHAVRTDEGWVVALSGAVHPDVIRVTVHFGDGAQYSFVTRNEGGWFVTLVPPDVADPSFEDGRLVNAPLRLELFDDEGARVASVDLSDVEA
jgi:hypothetical protein